MIANKDYVILCRNKESAEILFQRSIDIEKACLSTICRIARDSGVTTLIALDEEKIKEALVKSVPKKAKKLHGYSTIQVCPDCGRELIYSSKYCYDCGQRVEWEV